MKQDAGDGKMKDISSHIYEGALAFLNAEYKLLTIFVIVASILLAGISFIVPTTHILIVVAFIFGAFFRPLPGIWGCGSPPSLTFVPPRLQEPACHRH